MTGSRLYRCRDCGDVRLDPAVVPASPRCAAAVAGAAAAPPAEPDLWRRRLERAEQHESDGRRLLEVRCDHPRCGLLLAHVTALREGLLYRARRHDVLDDRDAGPRAQGVGLGGCWHLRLLEQQDDDLDPVCPEHGRRAVELPTLLDRARREQRTASRRVFRLLAAKRPVS